MYPPMRSTRLKNVGKTPGKMIVMLTPGKLLDYFRAIGDPIHDSSDYPDLKKTPDFSKLNVEKYSNMPRNTTFNLLCRK